MPSAERATDEPATRRSLLRRWAIVVVLGAVALTLIWAAGAKVRVDEGASALQRDGVAAEGRIVAVDAQRAGRARVADGSVEVAFEAEGQPRQAAVYVGTAVPAYHADQPVQVVYDASDPNRVELQGVTTSGRGLPAVPALLAGGLLGAMAFVAGRHAHRIRRVLRAEPWHEVASSLEQVPQSFGLRQGSRTRVVLETMAGPVTVEPVGLNRVDPGFAPQALCAGTAGRHVVLAAPGGGHVVLAKRVAVSPDR